MMVLLVQLMEIARLALALEVSANLAIMEPQLEITYSAILLCAQQTVTAPQILA